MARTRNLILVLLAGLAFHGCALPNPTVPGSEPKEEEKGGGGEPAEAQSWAGTWTRQGETPLVFTVTDDGSKVHGERTSGGEADFSSYSFDLTRKGKGLEGTATFALVDVSGKTYDAKWKATLEGSTIKVAGEELLIDPDTNEVTGREPKSLSFDYAAAAAAAEPPPAAPPAMDMSQFVTPLGNYKYLLADDVAVGQWVETEMAASGMTMKSRMAVVHDAGDAWVIEIDNQMNQKDLMIAAFVNKETGDTTKAYVGNRGKDAKEKAVTPPTTPPAGEAPTPTDEEVTVPAGTFAAKKTVMEVGGGTYTSWVGAEGSDAAGILLKSENPQGKDELTKLEDATVEVTGGSFETRHLTYSSGMELWMAKGTKPHLNQQVRMKTAASDMKVTAQGEDAKPEMNYPR